MSDCRRARFEQLAPGVTQGPPIRAATFSARHAHWDSAECAWRSPRDFTQAHLAGGYQPKPIKAPTVAQPKSWEPPSAVYEMSARAPSWNTLPSRQR